MLIPTPPAEPTPPPAVPTVIYLQPAPKPPSNPLALASLVCGIASAPLLFCCYIGLPLSLVALGLGVAGLIQSDQLNGLGRTHAIAGMAGAACPWVLGAILVFVGAIL